MLHQEGQKIIDGLAGDGVDIIQHQHQAPRQFRQVIDQQGRQHLWRGQFGRVERSQHAFPDARIHLAQRSREVGQKTRQVAIPLLTGQPRHAGRASTSMGPGANWLAHSLTRVVLP